MLKPLTLSVSLAAALVAGSVARAGGHGHGAPAPAPIPSAQVAPTEQTLPSPQGVYTECLPAKKCFDLSGLGHGLKKVGHGIKCSIPKIHLPKPEPKCYTYEWVLKKKRCGGGLLGMFSKCGHGGDSYVADTVYPTSQALPSGQGGDVYGTGQAGPSGQIPSGQFGTGQIPSGPFGAGQLYGAPEAMPGEAPGMMVPAEGDAAPAAPEVPGT